MTLTEQYNEYVQEWIKEHPAFSSYYESMLDFDEWIDGQLKQYKTLINVQNPDKSFFPIESLEKQIAINQEEQDKFTIEFAEWLLIEPEDDSMENCTTKELLEIFKKEKEL
jgi:hypothetical protein